MSVMMQAFYWDCPKIEDKTGEWWNHVNGKIEELAKAGFHAIWLPPASKAASVTSMGYDPYDYFDLGDYEQKGGTKTFFGNKQELQTLIANAHEHKIDVYADIVINHNSGADSQEVNPLDGETRWTRFTPKSERFPRDWNSFHPSRYEVAIEGLVFADFPHLCHRNPRVYTAMMEFCQMLIEEIGFDGFRFDFVKGYGPWLIGTIAKYRYERDGKAITPFCVGEYWEDNESIEHWVETVNSFSDNQISAFDFALKYRLKDLCDTPGYDLRRLGDEGVITVNRPTHAVTFVDNHDTEKDSAINDKMLAYSFILTHEGYPCVFWKDYYTYGLARPGTGGGIDALVAVHDKYAGGETNILFAEENLYVMERTGFEAQPGLLYILNNNGDHWGEATVKTKWPNTKMVAVAWDGHDIAQPEERTTDGEGNAKFSAAPRGYAVYAPA